MTEKKKIKFTQITALVKKCNLPLKDKLLEGLQEEFFGEYRHPYYRFLYYLTLLRKPKLAVEIGVDQGIASAHMCVAAASYGGHVIGIDKKDNHVLDDYENFHFLGMDSKVSGTFVAKLVERYGRIGLVFQDSDHNAESSKIEWNIMSKHFDTNAIWVCDDLSESIYPDLVNYFKGLKGQKKFYDGMHLGTRIGVSLL